MISVEAFVGITPFERPDPSLVVALARAGALGVLDLGRDAPAAEEALGIVARRISRGFGVRIPHGVDVGSLPNEARVVILTAGSPVARWKDRTVLVQVTSIAEARAALAHGAQGLIAKGCEAGGPVGDEPSFILLQRILAEVRAPVWAQGGIGVHTAAACIAAGARGVVLDAQLALLKESQAPAELKRLIASMDGSESRIVGGHRVFVKPGAQAPQATASSDDIAAQLVASASSFDLIAAGQDATFAKSFADKMIGVDGLMRTLRAAVVGHLRQARALKPLSPNSPLAVQHGITYPIAQGPMTRVSDRAPFAAAVAEAGALPFLALSLMRGAEARRVLEETAALNRGRTWGVGVLGFVPPEIRDEQLAMLLEIRPTVALIAGGRPSHARPLEDAGIAAYLHVPSPGLLDLFLKDGARRFIFEGRECGGHVGPRSSFVLWESAIERLLEFASLSEVSVLFAGGVHDARSAAMVSAMAAPLAARGAKIGVLMGTAYLFTEEAVATGAIVPTFQEEAMRCDRTVLLETAPGHATRCADTSYTQAFEAERARLEKEGKSKQEMWEALEQLNLGRLRMAAKGLRRDGDRIVDMDEAEQRQGGMYMIGQVATLRSGRCTMRELHRDVSEGAAELLERVELAVNKAPNAKPVDVAIVGMACIFPDAPNLQTFWKNVVTGANAIREVPAERWNPEQYYHPEGTGELTPSKWGGFVPDTAFDPMAYGIPPRSLAAIDPVQLLSLEVARRALDDSGYGDDAKVFDRERTSVIFGAESGTELAGAYGFRATYPQMLGELPVELEAHLPTLTEDSFAGVLANVIAGRIANRLDLGGANYTVDAACASSLAAIDLACKELSTGTSDMVISGGADLHNSINDYLMFASVHALSPTGQCRTFDGKADGIALGEGIAAVVLTRLSDAERDGDRVYAVIKGVGASSDGKSLGLTAPRKEGQARALERAYDAAGVSPADVGLIEAHGTGTVVGDRTELQTLTEVFSGAGALPAECTLGSVKSNIGHTKCAAGLAGLIKAALSVHHGILPPTLNLEAPNPAYDATTSPFAFRSVAAPWTNASGRRLAGISAFGFGGTNFHAVIASHTPETAKVGLDEWPAELFVFRGDKAAVERTMAQLEAILEGASSATAQPGPDAKEDGHRLRDLASSVARALPGGPAQVAIVATSVADLRNKLAAARKPAAKREPGVFIAATTYKADQVAFVFPGQGSQRPGMLADLFVAFPELSDLLRLGAKWLPILFPPSAFTDEGRSAQKAAITDTRVAQPTLGIVELAMARLLGRFGVKPAMTAGHSYGELVALAVAGSLPATSLLDVSEARATAILDAAHGAPGTMAAASASHTAVRQALGDLEGITLANHNAPDQTVIAGAEDAIVGAVERLVAHGISARRIPVACAFHSPIVAGASDAFAKKLATVDVSAPRVPVYSNSTAARYPAEPDAVRWQLARQLALPVRFADEIEAMYADGARVFVEAGPGGVLSDLVGRILKGRPHVAVRCDRASGLLGLLEALAELAVAGMDVNVAALFESRDARAFDLAAPPPVGPAATAWMINGYSARPLEGDLPEFALRIPLAPVVVAAPLGAPAAGEREAAVVEYLRSMRDIAEAQRQVMLRFLGEAAVPAEIGPVPVAEETTPSVAASDSSSARVSAPPPRISAPPPQLSAATPRNSAPPARNSVPPPVPSIPSSRGSIRPSTGPASRRVLRASRPPPPPPSAHLSALEALIATVSERTGYPAEMLDPELDLEADLGIDSIKRIEILGQMRDRLGLGTMTDAARSDALEELARFKTLRKIADWLEARVAKSGANADSDPPPAQVVGVTGPAVTAGAPTGLLPPTLSGAGRGQEAPLAPPASPLAPPADGEVPKAPVKAAEVTRYVLEVSPVAAAVANCVRIEGRTFAIVPDRLGVAAKLGEILRAGGARVRMLEPGDEIGEVDGLVHLDSLDPKSHDSIRTLFANTQAAVRGNALWIVGATGLGGRFGIDSSPTAPDGDGPKSGDAPKFSGGVAGLLKSVAKERPQLRVRAIDLNPTEEPAELAAHIYAELLADDQRVEVGYVGGVRHTLNVESRARVDGPALALDGDAVILITGGARGITAEVAVALARRFHCRLELVGRSTLGEAEDSELARATDPTAIRRLLLERANGAGPVSPAIIERACRTVIGSREVRRTLARIAEAGGRATYHAVDVRDADAFGAIIDGVYARHGRIDGVIHGAGVIEDRLLADKTRESFDRVFDTKVSSALTLGKKLRPDVRFVSFFSSVSGAFGNRGQVDYAAANDVLDKLAHQLAQQRRGGEKTRVLSVNWGPWGGVGMVSPELEREYAKRGVQTIPPEQGADRFVDELCHGQDAQVILAANTLVGFV